MSCLSLNIKKVLFPNNSKDYVSGNIIVVSCSSFKLNMKEIIYVFGIKYEK